MNNKKLYLLCYDIADDKRLYKALKIARHHALGGQKSVHECWLSNEEKQQLIKQYKALIKPNEDGFLLIQLNPKQTVHALGQGIIPEEEDWFYMD